ncbi:hypothetical protein NL425_27560, partial [Klebsiella pneumoniae]|nr:hypothetical protein [Klebsiella pneumoniae]
TYALNLATTLETLGYVPDALIGVRQSLSSKDPVLNRMSFYDPRAGEKPPLATKIKTYFRYRFGEPFGVGAVPLMRAPAVI